MWTSTWMLRKETILQKCTFPANNISMEPYTSFQPDSHRTHSRVSGRVASTGPALHEGTISAVVSSMSNVLAGLRDLYGTAGEITEKGAPLGLMGGAPPTADDFLTEGSEGGGVQATESLYIEVREAGVPVDPATWFAGP